MDDKLPFSRVALGLSYEGRQFFVESGSKPFRNLDRRFALAALNQAHVCMVDSRRLGKRFLRKPPANPVSSNNHRKGL